MWLLDDKMQAFRALSYGDKWRVSRSVARGEAPADFRMAPAAIELAESYQRHRGETALMRWFPFFMIAAAGFFAVSYAIDGDKLGLIVNAVIVLANVAQLFFNPASRPRNLTRSLEASRRIAPMSP